MANMLPSPDILVPPEGGDVTGPASATDHAVARFDTTTGKLLQDSVVIVDDAGSVSGVVTLEFSNALRSNSDGDTIEASNTNDHHLDLQARDTDNTLVEVARLQGAADPYFSMGGSQEFKFYYGGTANLSGNVTADALVTIDGRDVSVDGSKLDGIATAATKYPDTGEQAFLDADHTKLDGIDATADVTADNAPKAHEASHQAGGSDILYVPRTYVWFVKGTVATGTEQGATFRMKRATTVEDVEMHIKTAPTGAALIIDINDGGTTLFDEGDSGTRPEIDISGTTEDDNHAFSDTALAAATELTMDVDQVGSTVAGADLTVLLHCLEAVA